MTDECYMRRCLQLAKSALGNTYPNPLVGSVIVHKGKIIGEGYHQKAGDPHAEINAINSVANPELLKDSVLYVSLEPCSHFGKTPPCSDRIIATGFQKVVIGTLDLHDIINGKGKQKIEQNGIEVDLGVLETDCQNLNKRFFTFHQKKRPYIILKWAMSSDGFMDKNYQPFPIGNGLTKQFVHKLRSQEHAILIGTQTAINDNPTLTTREFCGRNPIRILIDFDLKVPRNYQIYNNDAKTMVFNSQKDGVESNIHFIQIQRTNFLENLMKKLYEHQIQSVLIEGGSYTLQQFINHNLWDEAIVIENPTLQLHNGTKSPNFNLIPDLKKQMRDNLVEMYTNPF